MTIDKQKLKALANEAHGQRLDWIDAGKPWPVWNSRLMDLHEKLEPETVLALLEEIEHLQEHKQHLVDLRETHGFDSWSAALVEIDRLKAENEELRKDADRYRWLIRRISKSQYYFLGAELTSNTEDGVCEAIDAAMAKEAK